MNGEALKRMKEVVQDCNINFLIGAGLSSPYLSLLGDLERWLTEVEGSDLETEQKSLLRASLYKWYFDGVISRNIEVWEEDTEATGKLREYEQFLTSLNHLLLKRKSTILAKQVNLFTTNIDIFLEKGLEAGGLEYSDGFSGRFRPVFRLSNFKKALFKKSLHYDNTSEIPMFNLLKLHGSLTWAFEDSDNIGFSADLGLVRSMRNDDLGGVGFVCIEANDTFESLVAKVKETTCNGAEAGFMSKYETLPVVNPTKEKFRDTLLNRVHYEMLRIYGNELEKENTVLFVMGFSFADEHIREITVRVADSNPTLLVYVIAYDSKAREEIEGRLHSRALKNANVHVIAPPRVQIDGEGQEQDEFQFDLGTINSELIKKLCNL